MHIYIYLHWAGWVKTSFFFLNLPFHTVSMAYILLYYKRVINQFISYTLNITFFRACYYEELVFNFEVKKKCLLLWSGGNMLQENYQQ